MADRLGCKDMIWTTTRVAPDYLSSSRKRLVPQLIYKGSILKAWGKNRPSRWTKVSSFTSQLPTRSLRGGYRLADLWPGFGYKGSGIDWPIGGRSIH